MDAATGRIRTIPPWVRDVEEHDHDHHQNHDHDHDHHPDHGQDHGEGQYLLPEAPGLSLPAVHHGVPAPKPNAPQGRHFDHLRVSGPVLQSQPTVQSASRWRDFAQDFGGEKQDKGAVADEQWWTDNMPAYNEKSKVGYFAGHGHEDVAGFWLFSPERRTKTYRQIEKTLMLSPFVPLSFRLIVIVFSSLALGLAGNIYHRVDHIPKCRRGSSTYLAIIVDTVAIAYSFCISYDEYTSKPLGLRSARAKMRLILLDLVFIVFDSANISIAIQALTDPNWACQVEASVNMDEQCPRNAEICGRQKALTATLLIALVAWLVTFSLSMLRLMERVSKR